MIETIYEYLNDQYENIDLNKGKFILQKKMLYDYCRLILETDLEYAPFEILFLEKEEEIEFYVNEDIGTVNLKAKIDRVDIKDKSKSKNRQSGYKRRENSNYRL